MTRVTDQEQLQQIVDTFFAAFTSGSRDALDRLREAFVPGAVIVKTCGDLAVYDVDGFLEPRAELLTNGTLTDFREWPLEGRFDVFGDIAHWWGAYGKEGVHRGVPTSGRGMKTMQFVRTPDGWRISAAAWDDER